MRLALYSDQIVPGNRDVDAALARVLPSGARVGYVPSAPDPERRWFEGRRRYYAEAGWDLAAFYEPNDDDPASLASLLACDAVHLSGGDTSMFRLRLERAGLMPVLRDYAGSGRVLIGTSAGGLMMTPTVALDAVYRGGDPAAERGSLGLGLVDFEFYPHAEPGTARFERVVAYSRASTAPVLACPDGSGIVVDGDAVERIGPGYRIRGGTVIDWHAP